MILENFSIIADQFTNRDPTLQTICIPNRREGDGDSVGGGAL